MNTAIKELPVISQSDFYLYEIVHTTYGYSSSNPLNASIKEKYIMWTKPAYTEMRFGFEVTMYIAYRE